MKILAIDYGTKNIGLALSDENQEIAFPYATLQGASRDNNETFLKVIQDIKKICKLEKVEKIIVGMPVNLAGDKTKTTELVFEFIKELSRQGSLKGEKYINIPIEEIDERFSTVQAQKKIQNKNAHNLDELSAQILLQSYLDKGS